MSEKFVLKNTKSQKVQKILTYCAKCDIMRHVESPQIFKGDVYNEAYR